MKLCLTKPVERFLGLWERHIPPQQRDPAVQHVIELLESLQQADGLYARLKAKEDEPGS